ncbi:MAG: tetratricopeptide repeat-containing sensor histidine kinase [Chloroherpetonaceae bacterium]|nr:tetratricopeptide repeat-containing sensor histidine kinase [Chloroherpetonaceae bacterium]
MFAQIESFKKKADSLLLVLPKIKYIERVDALNQVAEYLRFYSTDSSVSFANEALQLADSIGYKKGIADAKLWIGYGFDHEAKYDLAFDYESQALRIYQELNDKRGLAMANNLIGLIFRRQEKIDQSRNYILESLKYYEELGDEENVAVIEVNIGILKQKEKKYEEALPYMQKALPTLRKYNRVDFIGGCLFYIGETYEYLSKYDSASFYYRSCIQYSIESNNRRFIATVSYKYGRLLLTLKKNKEAKEIAELGLKASQEGGFQNEKKNMFELFSKIYSLEENFEKALYYYQSYATLNDSIIKSSTGSNIQNLQLKLENERKQAEFDRLKAESNQRKFFLYSLIILLSFGAFTIAVLINRFRIKSKSEIELRQKNLQIQRTLREEEALRVEAERLRHRAEEANKIKSEFLAIAAHDIKNPIQSILGFTQLMLNESTTTKEQKEGINIIRNATNRILDLVNNLLKSAELENEHLQLSLTETNLSDILKAVIEDNLAYAATKSISIEVQVENNLYSIADPLYIRDVFENLLSNAIKYSPLGKKVMVVASLKQPEMNENNQKIRIQFVDEGLGIRPSEMERLFGKFQRLSARPTGGESSTGLGLSIVKKIVDLHHAKIWVKSKGEGSGSTFFLEMNAISIQEPPA